MYSHFTPIISHQYSHHTPSHQRRIVCCQGAQVVDAEHSNARTVTHAILTHRCCDAVSKECRRPGLRAISRLPDAVHAFGGPFCSHHFEPPELLGMCVGIRAIWQHAGIVSMHDVVDLVRCEQLLDELGREVVGDAWGGGECIVQVRPWD